jgi:hypothetical protein
VRTKVRGGARAPVGPPDGPRRRGVLEHAVATATVQEVSLEYECWRRAGSSPEKSFSPAKLGFTPTVAKTTGKAPLDQESARALIASLDRRRFLEELDTLARAFAQDPGNPGSYGCIDCERCANCMFCTSCEGCFGCTHCTGCTLCNDCTHCIDSKSLNACAYCVQCENCANSAYLYFSRNLSDCTYCFGCVGLSKKDFHILNQPFSRQEYFELTKRLKKELGVR